ncbi:MAG: hypothetical protein AAB819_01795 [Patescibacteria group bacterium]
MKNFSWKWVAFGLGYSLLIMSILNMGLPAEVDGKPVQEWVQTAYIILTAGWGNFTVITAVSILAFSTIPWAETKSKPKEFNGLAIGIILLMLVPGGILTIVLTRILVDMLALGPIVLGVVLTLVLASILAGFLTIAVLGFVLVVLIEVFLTTTTSVFRNAARNTRLALSKND